MKETANRFDFSVIVPIYNMEEYLSEAIESITNQTIGFEDHIQLILVNDGSEDDSDAICKKYVEKYPKNIVYVAKKNEGVSVARNVGLKHASGKFINCLDADDKWSEDAFECAAAFFDNNPSVRIVAARHRFFGRTTSNHVLSYKFESDRIIHIDSTFDHPQLTFSNAFVSASLFPPDPFNGKLSIAEDFLVFSDILLQAREYGVISKPIYWYRKRDNSSSAMDSSTGSLSWYQDVPIHCHKHLFELSRERRGEIIPYIQYCVMYDLQWRIKNHFNHPLEPKQFLDYKKIIIDILSDIDDRIILAQRNISRETKLYTLALKHRLSMDQAQKRLKIIGNQVFWIPSAKREPVFFCHSSEENSILINFIHEKSGNLTLEGRLYSLFPIDRVQLVIETDNDTIPAPLSFHVNESFDSFFDKNFFKPLSFTVSIPQNTVSFKLIIDEHCFTPAIRGGKFCPMSFRAKSYLCLKEKVLTCPRRGVLEISDKNNFWKLKRETLYQMSLWLNDRKARECLKYRRYALRKRCSETKRRIWLISDRITMAGDNGEALFAFLQQNPIPHVKPYFVIAKDSDDYTRLKRIGNVVPYGSDQHKRLSLIADKIISSAGEDNVFNIFGRQGSVFQDLVRYKFVFLQHGVTKDDISGWLNRFAKNISLFITASPREKDSIINNPKYGYTNSQVVCTGFPRHDKLLKANGPVEKKVIIAPTWRNSLALPLDQESGLREPYPLFEESEYCNFYNRLLNDPRIEASAKQYGYSIDFLVHPAFRQEIPCFHSTFCRIVPDFEYAEEFADSLIMLTDYSSVAFDFALLKKPILYTQFDIDTFFEEHSYKQGYYDYEKDGFGPICYTYEETVNRLLDLMENPKMEQTYLERVDSFFYTPATSRCQEVVDAILALDNPQKNK